MRPRALIPLALLAAALPGPALALCDLSVQGVNFGNIDTTRDNTSTGRITLTCSEAVSVRVLVSMGANSLGTERALIGPHSTILVYNLYIAPDWATAWGDDVFLPGKTVIVNAAEPSEHTVYGLLFRPQQPPPQGTYQDMLTVTLTF